MLLSTRVHALPDQDRPGSFEPQRAFAVVPVATDAATGDGRLAVEPAVVGWATIGDEDALGLPPRTRSYGSESDLSGDSHVTGRHAGTHGVRHGSLILECLLCCCYRCGGSSHDRWWSIRYPLRFQVLLFVVIGMSLMWMIGYLVVVEPETALDENRPYLQLSYNARMLFCYFTWFAVARSALFIPCVIERVVQVQPRTHGFCYTYCMHLVLRDGPLYIFVLGSLLFWFHLSQVPADEQAFPFFSTMRLFAICSNLVSTFTLILSYWHNKLMMDAFADVEVLENGRGAPPDTIRKLETRAYDAEVFGDEEGKLYPGECPICLAHFEPLDQIKVTPCGHAFHEECLGNWLQTARTCALCRRDLVDLDAADRGDELPADGDDELPSATPERRDHIV